MTTDHSDGKWTDVMEYSMPGRGGDAIETTQRDPGEGVNTHGAL